MPIYALFSAAARARARVRLYALHSRVLVLALVCAICLISTLTLQTALAAHTASSQVAPNPPDGKTYPVVVYLDHRKLHDYGSCPNQPGESCNVHEYIDAGTYQAQCQQKGEQIEDLGYTNEWWMLLQAKDGWWGWVTNIYIKGDTKIAGPDGKLIPDCNFSSSSSNSDKNTTGDQCPTDYLCVTVNNSTGASGSAIFKFTSKNSFTVSSMSVKDTQCNSHEVSITFHKYDQNDNTGLDVDPGNQKHNNGASCNTNQTWQNVSFTENTGTIQALQIKVCDDGPGNTCQSSSKYVNTYAS